MARTFSGQRLRDERINAGLKPERLALLSEISVWSVHGYERGRVQPSTGVLIALADALHISVDALLVEAVTHDA